MRSFKELEDIIYTLYSFGSGKINDLREEISAMIVPLFYCIALYAESVHGLKILHMNAIAFAALQLGINLQVSYLRI